MPTLRLGVASLNQTPIDWEGNRQRIVAALESAKTQKVDILCLPELCITGYGCEDLFLSEWVPTKALEMLPELAGHTEGICATVGLPLRLDGRVYNAVAIMHNGRILGSTPNGNWPTRGCITSPAGLAPGPMARSGMFSSKANTSV